jgi:hypothetical protein
MIALPLCSKWGRVRFNGNICFVFSLCFNGQFSRTHPFRGIELNLVGVFSVNQLFCDTHPVYIEICCFILKSNH